MVEKTPAVPRARVAELNRLLLPVRLGSFAAEFLNWDYVEPRRWRNDAHAHSFFEARYAVQGRATFRIVGAEYAIAPGMVFVARPGEVHEIVSDADDPVGLYHWTFTLAPARDAPRDARGVDALLGAFLRTPRWVDAGAPAIERTLELLTEEIARREPGYLQAIDGLAAKLLLDTARAIVREPLPPEQEPPAARDRPDAVAGRIAQFLQDNYARPLTIREVAGEVHLSERHANRLFRQVMGVPILEYLTTVRLEIACRLLRDPQLSIKEVAQASGYPNVHYFTTLFHRHIGIPPAAFRRRAGGCHSAGAGRADSAQ